MSHLSASGWDTPPAVAAALHTATGFVVAAVLGAAALGPIVLLLSDRTSQIRRRRSAAEVTAVAALTGILTALVAAPPGAAPGTTPGAILLVPAVTLGVAAAIVDATEHRLPDLLTGPLLVAALLSTAASGALPAPLLAACVALLIGLAAKAAHPGGVGWGDVKLLPSLTLIAAAHDAVWPSLLVIGVLICATATWTALTEKGGPVPYGPALVLATLTSATP